MSGIGRATAVVGTAAAAVLLLSSCAGTGKPEPQVLTASEAGGQYLAAVCPVNAAWDRADVELDRLRLALSRDPKTPGDPEPFARAIGAVATASTSAEKQLGSTEVVWPKPAAPAVERVRESLAEDAAQAGRVAKLDDAAAVGYRWQPGDAAAADAQARTAFGLAGDPEAACAQWRTQQKQQQKKEQRSDSNAGSDAGAKAEQ